MSIDQDLSHVQSLLDPSEVIPPTSPLYGPNAQGWAVQKDLHPRLVAVPTSPESLARLIAHLYKSHLHFGIRGQGFLSASAKDVLVSMTAFDEFHFDPHAEVATVGAGQTWGAVYRKLKEAAPSYAIVGARTPAISVGGTVVTGGLSWLSAEYGCISDPENMLDAQVVKSDGSVVWASTEPDLLWTMRGGGGGFGVATKFLFRVRPYPQAIWAGPILLPRQQLPTVATRLEAFLASNPDPRVSMFLYIIRKNLLETIGAFQDMLVVHAYDANGEEHGREAFKWALDIPGAVDQTGVTDMEGVTKLQQNVDKSKGTMRQYWAPLFLKTLSAATITRAIELVDELAKQDSAVSDCTYLIFELFALCDAKGSCAWPRPPGAKHVILIGAGCPANASAGQEEMARNLAEDASERILGSRTVNLLANGGEEFHDPVMIWGENLDRLRQLKKVYDPNGRFQGPIRA
ncbi:FAD-binding domain-containing protein [Aspergillus campestris IBT 28561]|uniref:FAD-binding domain-containing protein n=1 Tax=Aspergillus campestris (strain IBT 28561) TaxID=1392248 RepID=A0A2I1CZQ9_ASPC2|nr:FAD-binding domain-containing protein [Aspergillus campestris IBT 28561]PKY03108.1 FAD-binding domain-containing protein [Aspergillus campestris IBT 28561]